MASTSEMALACRVVRAADAYEGKQGPTYAAGISREQVGAQAIWLGKVTIQPGARTRAHFHAAHESAFYVVSGECELWFGNDLSDCIIARADDYLYIPAGVSHVAVNRSPTEPFVVIGGRTDASEHESVVLQPELDERVP